jgi:predicted  nucleic acid-binding Zn-ribbon protein
LRPARRKDPSKLNDSKFRRQAPFHAQEKNRVAKEQIAADTDEIARLDKELGHVVPKLEALERGLAVKRAEKEGLLAEIKRQTEEFNEVRRSSVGTCGSLVVKKVVQWRDCLFVRASRRGD